MRARTELPIMPIVFTIAVLAMTFVVVRAGLGREDWINPPDDGPGPSPGSAGKLLYLVACLLAPLAVIVFDVFDEWASPAGRFLRGLIVLACVAAMGWSCWPMLWRSEYAITEAGFASQRIDVSISGRLSFYNASGAPLTVCVGRDGRCEDGRDGAPPRLRGAGLTLSPDQHRRAGRATDDGEFPLTIAGAPGRNAVLVVQSGSPGK